jgi:type II secretory pathway component GspD/PulD (secretin)
MIDTLALAVVLSSNSGGICKRYVALPPAKAASVVSFRGVGPKRLSVSVSETLKSYGLGGPTLSSRILLSFRSPLSTGILLSNSKPAKVGTFEARYLPQTLDRPIPATLTDSSAPPAPPVVPSASVETKPKAEKAPVKTYSFPPAKASDQQTGPVQPAVPAQASGPTTAANKFAESAAIAAMEKRVSVALSATPLETVVSLLSKQAGINIVLISKADQKVTLNVKDMPLGEAMKHLSALAGVRVLKVRNTLVMADDAVLKVAYPAEYAAEAGTKQPESEGATIPPTVIPGPEPKTEPASKGDEAFKVVTLKHLGASPIVAALKDLSTKMGVTIVAMPNSLVPRLQVGTTSSGQGSTNTAGQGAGVDPNADNSRTILISGPAKAVAQIEAIINSTDIARRQVQITVTIHDVSDSALNEQGIQWVPGQFNVTEATNLSMNGGTFQRSGVSFTATMKALEQADKARLLSSPNVNVMDGEASSILIGERRQFPIVSSFNANGQPIFSIQESKIGIQLDVSAQITADGSITLAVRPEVSSIIEFLNLNGGTYPQIATRSSENKLTMHDGDTMVIGGLVKEEDIKNYQRMPLLSNIPFFGELFKSRRIEKRKSQLIISITPNIIKQ